MVKWGEMGLFRALFLAQNSCPVKCSDWEMGFMVAMACRWLRVVVWAFKREHLFLVSKEPSIV